MVNLDHLGNDLLWTDAIDCSKLFFVKVKVIS